MELLEKIDKAKAMIAKGENLLDESESELFELYKKWDQAINGEVSYSSQHYCGVEADDDSVTIHWKKSYCGCCPPSNDYTTIDRMFFCDFDQAVEDTLARIEDKKNADAVRAAREKAERAEKKELQERAQLEALQRKYGHEPTS